MRVVELRMPYSFLYRLTRFHTDFIRIEYTEQNGSVSTSICTQKNKIKYCCITLVTEPEKSLMKK